MLENIKIDDANAIKKVIFFILKHTIFKKSFQVKISFSLFL